MKGIPEIILLFLTVCSSQLSVRSDSVEDDSIDKRAPGWGKRDATPNRLGYLESVLTDLSRYELNKNNDNLDLEFDKRRPGWGKRSFSEDFELDKRKPGWGKRAVPIDSEFIQIKRAPGWGKRSYGDEEDLADMEMDKRRPGWGKRSSFDDFSMEKRRPGWGKRAPGWGKRSDVEMSCQNVINQIRLLRLKLAQMKEELAESCSGLSFEEAILNK